MKQLRLFIETLKQKIHLEVCEVTTLTHQSRALTRKSIRF